MRQLHVSALLGRVYWADVKDNVIVGKKTDVTENFLGCVMQFFSNPEKGLIHDANGNEWKVTIVQTKTAVVKTEKEANINMKKGDRVVYKKDERFKGTVLRANGGKVTVKVERSKDKDNYDGLFDYLFNYPADDFEVNRSL